MIRTIPLGEAGRNPASPPGADQRWEGDQRWIGRRGLPVAQAGCVVAPMHRDDRFEVAVQSMIDPFGIYRAVRDASGSILDFEVVYVNDAACRSNRLTREQQVGRRLCDLFPSLRGTALFSQYCEVVRSGQPLAREAHEFAADFGQGHEVRIFDLRASRLGDGFVAVWRDMTAQRELERQAREAMAQAQRHKDQFIAVLSHELRNTLTPIRYGVSMLQAEADPHLQDDGVVAMLDRQLQSLTRLVDDMLDVTRIETGKLEMRIEEVALADVLQRVLETCLPAVQERGQVLRVDPVQPMLLRADPVRLCQALSNLLLNAVKHSREGGEIRIRAEAREGTVRIEVSDDGAGFDPADAERIFGLYRQAVSGAQGGLGIGLHLVRRIMELLAGGADARSAGPGQGSTFGVWLPKA
ncbi:ATP-binding protein [Ramlibacter sp. MMS24-I3-19]|uniref:PAS domain-containing sensor histidine kinase n=1 Tax=Ramlibacter sp. MMS24-I3-19 TaxID=3416606 RepID=UPI003D0776DD